MEGKFLVKPESSLSQLNYQRIQTVEDFANCDCIVVKALHPDFSLLLGSIKLIITEQGSQLSHLAILAREHHVPVFLTEQVSSLPQKGALSIHGTTVVLEK